MNTENLKHGDVVLCECDWDSESDIIAYQITIDPENEEKFGANCVTCTLSHVYPDQTLQELLDILPPIVNIVTRQEIMEYLSTKCDNLRILHCHGGFPWIT